MRRGRSWGERLVRRLERGPEDGSASLEFLGAGLILLLPLVYLVVTVGTLQGATLAAEGAARHAARVYVQSPSPAEARAAAQRAVEFAFDDYGLDPSTARVTISCVPASSGCLLPEALVTVRVETTVPLPFVPAFVVGAIPASVPVHAQASQEVSRFGGGEGR